MLVATPSPMAEGRSQRRNMIAASATAAENQPRGLGHALEAMKSGEPRRSVGLEEHMESDVGHNQNDEDLISVPDIRNSTTTKPKRSSLVEYSREFKEKFKQFMAEYDEEDGVKITGSYNDIDLEASNRFPTRGVDLRQVDQGTNLMDASSARHDWREDSATDKDYYYDENNDEVYNGDEEEEDDVYANYTEGYNAKTNPDEAAYADQAYIDDTSFRPAIAGCGGVKAALENEKRSMKMDRIYLEKLSSCKNKASSRCDWGGWCFVFMMLSLATILLASMGMFKSASGISDSIVSSVSSIGLGTPPPSATLAPTVGGNSAGDVERRRLVLDHVLKEELLKESHAAVLSPTHPSAQKAILWMTKYDPTSMKLLDNFNYHPYQSMNAKDALLKKEDVDDPDNHAKQITERYVEVVFWFESHPSATPETAVIH